MEFTSNHSKSTSENLRVIIRALDAHPACEHGPALLFERRSGDKCQQFYACSAYRDKKDCQLYIPVDAAQPVTYNRDILTENAIKSAKFMLDASHQLQKVFSNGQFISNTNNF